jgi:hypothetical protein
MTKKLDMASNVLPVSVPHISKEKKELAKEKLKELIQEETQLVRGIFQFFESPGGSATITVRKYPGVPMFTKSMKDGMMYEIPKYVARFLNGTDVSARAVDGHKDDSKFIGTCSYGVYDFKVDGGADMKTSADLLPVAQISNFTRRFGFQSTDFGGAR